MMWSLTSRILFFGGVFWGVIALAKITVGITAGDLSPIEVAEINDNNAVDDAIEALENYRVSQHLPIGDQLELHSGSGEPGFDRLVTNIPRGRLGEVLGYFQESDFSKNGTVMSTIRDRLRFLPIGSLEPYPLTDLDAYMVWMSLDGEPPTASEFAKIIPGVYYNDPGAAIDALYRYPYDYSEEDRKSVFELALEYQDYGDLRFVDNFAVMMDEIQLATGADFIDLSGEYGTRLLKKAILDKKSHVIEYLLARGARVDNEENCVDEVDLEGSSFESGPKKQIKSVSENLMYIWHDCHNRIRSAKGIDLIQLDYLKDQNDPATISQLEQCLKSEKESKKSEILSGIPSSERGEIWKIFEPLKRDAKIKPEFFHNPPRMHKVYLERYCAEALARSWLATEEIKEMIHPKKKEEVNKAPRIQIVRKPKKKIGKCDFGLLKTQLDNAVDRLEDYDVATAGGTGKCTYIVQRKSGEIQITRYNFTEKSLGRGASEQKGAR